MFSKPEMTAQVYEKELLAVIHALTQWRHYLLGADFIVFTDHQSLRYFLSQKQLLEKQMRWANILSQFHFQIVHVQGHKNVVADALSRMPLVQAISAIHHSSFEDMVDEYATDTNFADIFTWIGDGETVAGYSIREGYLMRKTMLLFAVHVELSSRICPKLLYCLRSNIISMSTPMSHDAKRLKQDYAARENHTLQFMERKNYGAQENSMKRRLHHLPIRHTFPNQSSNNCFLQVKALSTILLESFKKLWAIQLYKRRYKVSFNIFKFFRVPKKRVLERPLKETSKKGTSSGSEEETHEEPPRQSAKDGVVQRELSKERNGYFQAAGSLLGLQTQIYGTGFDTGETVATVLLFFDQQRFVFNVGEGLQRFCTEHRIKLSKVWLPLVCCLATLYRIAFF
ncbi:hypothetical protein L7F22_027917 [Adiantum nelumboides]|nr:hypothetical protein [Adiantum nelumboides]